MGMNMTIQGVLTLENAKDAVHLVACCSCFEVALFGQEVKEEKPYSALERIRSDQGARSLVKQLLDGLLDTTKPLPAGCKRWTSVDELV